jgi:hypothetical protein
MSVLSTLERRSMPFRLMRLRDNRLGHASREFLAPPPNRFAYLSKVASDSGNSVSSSSSQ